MSDLPPIDLRCERGCIHPEDRSVETTDAHYKRTGHGGLTAKLGCIYSKCVCCGQRMRSKGEHEDCESTEQSLRSELTAAIARAEKAEKDLTDESQRRTVEWREAHVLERINVYGERTRAAESTLASMRSQLGELRDIAILIESSNQRDYMHAKVRIIRSGIEAIINAKEQA